MTTSVAVLIPVLARPAAVRPLVESLAASSRLADCTPLFLVSPGDLEEQFAVELETRAGRALRILVDWEPGAGDYGRKINLGAREAVERDFEFLFLAADDLVFRPGWVERALACHLETAACVVGTNDLGNRRVQDGDHSTHTLVHRDYVDCGTIDEPDSGKLLHEGYDHNFVDVEFVQTAIARETWAHAGDSLVEHLHPLWRKGEADATYQKGQARFGDDRALYESRRRLWENE